MHRKIELEPFDTSYGSRLNPDQRHQLELHRVAIQAAEENNALYNELTVFGDDKEELQAAHGAIQQRVFHERIAIENILFNGDIEPEFPDAREVFLQQQAPKK